MSQETMTQMSEAHLRLANAVSDAYTASMREGVEPDEAISIILKVAVDYARDVYGDEYTAGLGALIVANLALPKKEPELMQ